VKYKVTARFNPYHDELGRFTTADGEGAGGIQKLPPGSYPVQNIDFNKAFEGLKLPPKIVHHDLHQWVDDPMDFLDSWEQAKHKDPTHMVNAFIPVKFKYKVKVKFNPYHDELGRFANADHDVGDAGQLKSYMNTLAASPGYHPNIAGLKLMGHPILNPDKNLGIKREDMPQIPTAEREAFLASLPATNKAVNLDPRKLNPVQAQIDGHKTALFLKQSMAGTDRFRPPLVSRDGYVIDGHHNWASRVIQTYVDPWGPDLMPARQVDMGHEELLSAAHVYAAKHGFEAKTIYKYNPNHVPAGSPDGGQFTFITGGGQVGNEASPELEALGPFHHEQYGIMRYTENQAAHDLNQKLYMEHVKWFSEHPQIATDVADYMSSDYGPLNAFLRTGVAKDKFGMVMADGEAKSTVARLERAIDEAPVIPDGTTLYRAFRSDSVVQRAEAGDLEGKVFQDKAFLSTTANPFIANVFYSNKDDKSNAVIMRMTTHDNVQGLYTAASTYRSNKNPSEYEVLLNRSTPMYIDHVTKLQNGGLLVDASVYGDGNKAKKFNPNHDPANGQFTSGEGGVSGAWPNRPNNRRPYHPPFPNSMMPQSGPNVPRLNDIDGDGQGDLSFMQPLSKDWGPEYDLDELDYATPNPNSIHDALAIEHLHWRQDLPSKDGAAVSAYQSGEYRTMNGFAANTNENYDFTPEARQAISDANFKDDSTYNIYSVREHVRALDEALNNAPQLADGIPLYRTFRSDALVSKGTDLIGETYRDPRFLSTSANGAKAGMWITDRSGEEPNIVLMKLTTSNARGAYLTAGATSTAAYEHEVLFDRNTPVKVTAVRPLIAYGQPAGIVIEGTIGGG
jgi:hypothetical protein